ncbi:lactate utilization protein C [Aneurinibacillus thermoaerophilus]|uniref:Lactate utilization protein C n=1 Tax=Aneurinibacillus thermoaerophilus TaxID=143495 RepID=A0A1G7Y083_ANETH|nr:MULTISPECIES: lactate utilization protein C [Aneurinibacillus]AMA72990.1 lactate utilization protein C [Aneurinibacillus sp. XH2]MED0677787.1 lactate utilization protein C [Aneurinibacillus thermoaerophilus]MED0758107.1 lactate utilization protein C [Aneurinibacillus thermoaerophilus]MED0761261.1 lactate utilization protein C [Aneurinibacillus thermoaerophilus]MED0762863.1 lactate utilization protein C [Aneurinibacillus thermoaerophilus]
MTIRNREAFLNQIAVRLGRERRTDGVVRPDRTHGPQLRKYKDRSMEELVDVLKEQCLRIHTDLKLATSATLPRVMEETIAFYRAKSIIRWEDQRFAEYGLDVCFDRQKADKNLDVYVWNPERGEENIRAAEKADIGITFSDMTLAESGTVVLFDSGEKGRVVSLLPKYYIAVIPKSTIVPRMTQATRRIHEMAQEKGTFPSCINFISGPSNSADIEMNLIVGVHGPIKATYIVVENR